ncbi:MAG: DUF4255 domain-containing protein [Cyanobacteria bacterium P01_G01_bin.67]
MSNSNAIAAVTVTLKQLLQDAFGTEPIEGSEVLVEAMHLDKIKLDDDDSKHILNLFLYHTSPNAAWRNMDLPPTKPGETGQPPLALDLYYLISAFSNNSDIASHQLLGKAMSILHDNTVLRRGKIKEATERNFPDNGLDLQVEKVRITPQSLSLEDISRLWNSFQTTFRISAVYEISVVLIESTLPNQAPLPVLSRGENDKGVDTQTDLVSPYPTLSQVEVPNYKNKQPSVRLAESLKLLGSHLGGETVRAFFRHPALEEPNEITIPATDRSANEITVVLPDEPGWPSGFYTVLVVTSSASGENRRETVARSFSLAPTIDSSIEIEKIEREDANNDLRKVTIKLTCKPLVWPNQQVGLILSDREAKLPQHDQVIKTESPKELTDSLTFVLRNIPAEQTSYFVRPRLRIDGVDSFVVRDYAASNPTFIDYQELIL